MYYIYAIYNKCYSLNANEYILLKCLYSIPNRLIFDPTKSQ